MIIDGFNRVHDYLRISLTDNCNLRCFYCMPEEEYTFTAASKLMQVDEIEAIAIGNGTASRETEAVIKKIHFKNIFNDEPWMQRLRGVVANASRCSHAELEIAEELDDGDPKELGVQVGGFRKNFSHFNIFGGCCGSDLRHMKCILKEAKAAT